MANELLARSYWGKTGKHQESYDFLRAFIPDRGEAPGMFNMLRCAGNIYHDCYNNGGCNLDVKRDQLDIVWRHFEEIVSPDVKPVDEQNHKRIMAFFEVLFEHSNQLKEADGSMCLPRDWSMASLEAILDTIIHHTKIDFNSQTKEFTNRKLRLVLDRREVFLNDPGRGHPAMVQFQKPGTSLGRTKHYDSTYWCAIGEMELLESRGSGVKKLTEGQVDWLEKLRPEVEEFLKICP